ncbi:hypothetical protein [Ferruginivarius sediminum]|uniref:Uncharacterized protein n=1 Tax=Ferruginivarius sediminum TaxID=2661937 RepID=A0A369T8C2_9PROT|nr:hypothetical protein [Ferruginivarius sediminum]RDD61563.1 hypothetical protein DRB17_12790 [Ferruginivarius sediminum]
MATDKSVVEAVAKAIYESDVRRLDELVDAFDLNIDEFEPFFTGLKDESDRAIGVLAFTYIETVCTDLMSQHLSDDIPGGKRRLFDSNGPLSTVSSRFLLARSLNWISSSTFSSLSALRKIRNEFAHSHTATDFQNTRIHDLISSIPSFEQAPLDATGEEWSLCTRHVFHLRSIYICSKMMEELISAPIATRMGLPPGTGVSRPFDELPQRIKDIRLTVASTMLAVLNGSPELQ